jgi:D-alanyl-D-alanine carboxypeptidase
VLQLAEEGRLDLDAAVATYLPDLLPDGDAISVRHLLQHRSGLYDYLEDIDFVSRAYRDPTRSWAPAELVAYATGFPLAFAPGADGAWDYSSTNYVVLGMLIEQVTGNSLAAELRARIFEPLELRHTFVAPFEASDDAQARGYAEGVDHTRVAMSFVFATGNLLSTASDLQRCVDALFDGRLLQPESLAAMTTFVDGNGQYGMPELAYGLGLMRHQFYLGPRADGQARAAAETRVYGHIGGFGGFRSAVWHNPERDITIALSINQSMTDPNPLAAQILDAVLRQQGQ